MATPGLGISQVQANQNAKELTINNADLALEQAGNRPTDIDMSGGNVTLSSTTYTRNYAFKCSGQTANRDLIVPLELTLGNPCYRTFCVLNLDSVYTITVKGATGATVTVNPLSGAMISSDGVDLTALVVFDAGGSPVDLGGFWRDVLTNDCIVLAYKFTRSVAIAVDAAGSQASCGTNPTATATLNIKLNGGLVGTLVFSTGGVPTWTIAGGIAAVAGDELIIHGPVSADATLADVNLTVAGFRG